MALSRALRSLHLASQGCLRYEAAFGSQGSGHLGGLVLQQLTANSSQLEARTQSHRFASTSSSQQVEQPQESSSSQKTETPASSQIKQAPTFSTAGLMTDTSPSTPLQSAEYASSMDDKFGVQKNWFTSLYKQLNYLAKTGAVTAIKGRQREVFEQVEKEFEGLYIKYVRDKKLDDQAHRSMLMCCLSVATYRILNDELGDTKLVRDIIRTNLGSVMLAILQPVHRFKLWILRHLLREDMYQQAVNFLPALTQDMGSLCTSSVAAEQGGDVTTMTVTQCMYHDMLTQEETPFLVSEFCCHHGLLWLHDFRKHNVIVSLDQCMAWDDQCCKLRVARPGTAGKAAPAGPQSEGAAQQ